MCIADIDWLTSKWDHEDRSLLLAKFGVYLLWFATISCSYVLCIQLIGLLRFLYTVSHDRNTLTHQVHLPRVWPHRLSCICRSGFRHDWQCRFGLAWLCYLVGWCRGFWWAVAWLQVIRWCLNIEIYTKLVIWMGNLIDHCRFLDIFGVYGIPCFGITTGSCQLALKICLTMGRTVYQVILWTFTFAGLFILHLREMNKITMTYFDHLPT